MTAAEETTVTNSEDSTAPADGLAPVSAGVSASTIVIKCAL